MNLLAHEHELLQHEEGSGMLCVLNGVFANCLWIEYEKKLMLGCLCLV